LTPILADLYDQGLTGYRRLMVRSGGMSMSVMLDPAGDDAVTGSLTSPLSSIEILTIRASDPASNDAGTRAPDPPVRPLALRVLRPAPQREIPEHVYDPVRQVATDAGGRPLVPDLKKDWTTIEGTHTDGDGGDNEMWEWEGVK
jgi:putative ATP-grasp target RiPP